MKGKLARATKSPEALTLTFRGLDLCDGCGTRLDAEDRLWGLCPSCQGADAGGHITGEEF
jgi:hypothetical protein